MRFRSRCRATARRAALGLGDGDRVVALLPGSRRSEIQYIAPRLLGAAAELQRQRPGLRFVLPVVPGLRHLVEPLRRQHAPDVEIELLDGRSHEALAACDVMLVASGTATLEAALFKRPMVIVYAMHALSWQMMKRMNYQPWVGAAEHPAERLRGARTAAGRCDAGADRRGGAGLARRSRGVSSAGAALRAAAPATALRHREGGDRCDRSEFLHA